VRRLLIVFLSLFSFFQKPNGTRARFKKKCTALLLPLLCLLLLLRRRRLRRVDSLSLTRCILFTRVLLCIAWELTLASSFVSSSSFWKKTKQVPHRGGYSRDDISRHRKLIRAD
jgi:hypothetical protein